MTSLRRLLALGLGAYALLLVVTFPAQLVMGQLGRLGIEASGVSGSVWNGRAAMLRVAALNLGQLSWDLEVLKLLTGRASANVELQQEGAFASGHVAASPSGRVTLTDFNASWPIAALAAAGLPAGWTGMANVALAEAVLDGGLPVAVTGTIDLMNLVGPANRPASLGSYRATFPATAATGQTGEGIDADLKDLDGPIEVAATLHVGRDRSFVIDGQIATRPDAPAEVISALKYLGESDAEGRRPFSVSGTF
jgi:general secretion pathway protein N